MEKEKAIEIMTELLKVLDLNVNQLASALEMNRAQAIYDILNPGKKVGISKAMSDKICGKYPQIDKSYLLTGEGSMIKNTGLILGNNSRVGNYSGNINRNNINVTLPEAGTQKIIKPDGSVEILNSISNLSGLEGLKRENDGLRQEIFHLKDTIGLKDDLIASLKETIKLLKHN